MKQPNLEPLLLVTSDRSLLRHTPLRDPHKVTAFSAHVVVGDGAGVRGAGADVGGGFCGPESGSVAVRGCGNRAGRQVSTGNTV